MKRLALFAVLAVAGCAEAPAPMDVMVSCPPLSTWTPGEQAALAVELSPLSRDSMLVKLELDWQKTRDSIRACQKVSIQK